MLLLCYQCLPQHELLSNNVHFHCALKVERRQFSRKLWEVVGIRLTISVIHKFLLEFIAISPNPLTRCFLQKSISWLFEERRYYELSFCQVCRKSIVYHQSLETESSWQTKVQNIVHQNIMIRRSSVPSNSNRSLVPMVIWR